MVAEIGINQRGATANKGGDLMRIPGIACAGNNIGIAAQTLFNKMIVHSTHG